MKKTPNILRLLFIYILVYSHNMKAQVVDESINGIQVGYWGIWWHNETKTSANWAFRTEIGYESPLITGNDYPIFLPIISFEPRWYYNSPKRQGNSKNYFHNSSNFASLNFRFFPEFGALSPLPIEEIDGGIFIIPTWGIRRNLSYRLNYELGIGFGVDVYELLTTERSTTDMNFNVHIRLGYKYGRKTFHKN